MSKIDVKKKHIELNEPDSSYTGVATYYFGNADRDKGDKNLKDAFLSISDCHFTIRLHPNTRNFNNNEMIRFKKKLRKLRDFIDDFVCNLPDDIEKV